MPIFEVLLQILNFIFSLFSSKENIKSPTIRSNIKNKNGDIQANPQINYGNNCHQNINNYNNSYQQPENSIDNEIAWEKLLECFSEKHTLKIIEEIKDPRSQQFFKHNLKGKKDFITNQFKTLNIHSQNKKKFHSIYKKAIETIDFFVETRDEEAFKQSWKSLYQALVFLRL